MKKIILFLTICMTMMWSADLHATHLVGAELTWTIVGPHQYIVKLSVYRDCNTTVPLATNYRVFWQSVTCNDTGSFLVTTDTAAPINETDTCPSQHSTCDGGSVYGVLDFVYTSAVVDLPAGCPDVVLSWASGNRNGVITNLTNPLNDALYISAELNTSLIDNSPQFLNPLTVDLCLGQTNYINQGGYDPDGDSLVYVLDTAQGDNGGPNAYPYTPINLGYAAGYTPSHPITSTTFNFSPSTGEITVIPTNTEVDVVKLVVYEYRNGVLIGHVERDMQVTVQTCTDTLPTISGIGSINSTDSIYTIEPCTSKCFTIYTAGSDSAKILTLSITGQNAFPGATFTISSGNDPSLTFCWSPTRENAGTYTFYVTVKDNACPEPGENTKGYTVIVPEIYPAGPDQTICQYTSTNALGTSTQSGSWTQMSVNPVVTNIVTPTSPTTLITGFTAAGRYNFIWTSDTTCIDTMSVFVTAKPNAGPDQTICQNSTATMAGSGSGTWRAMSGNPAATTIADSILATTTITGFTVVGTYHFIWTVDGCTDTMSVTVETRPNAGPDQSICGGNGTISMAATSGSGPWTADSLNPATTVITNPTSPTTTITGLTTAGIYTYYWGVGCQDTVLISINTKPNGGPNQSICENSTVTMGATGTGTWSAEPGNPATTTIANPASDSTLISGFTAAGTYSFIWTDGTCADTVKVTVIARPTGGPDQSICLNNTVTMAAIGTGTWTAGANPATTVITTPTSPTTTITGFTVAGTYTYYWSSTSCSGSLDTVLIVVNPKPNGGQNQTTCQYSTATMGATGTGTWSALGTNPVTTTIVTPTSPTTEITGFTSAGTYKYIWTVNGCNDTVSVTVVAKPNAGPDQTICQYTTTEMNGTGSGVWTVDPHNPSVITFANDTVPTTLTSGYNLPGTDTLYWTHNGCSDTVLIHVTAKPNAGPDQTTCQYSTATMDATGTGTWTALSTNPVTTTIVTPTSPTTEITGFTQPGTYGYVWTSNGCTDTAYVTVVAKPNAGPDQTICQYTTTDMNGTGSGVWTVDPNNPSVITFANDTVPTTLTSGYNLPGTDTLYWTHNGCSDTVLIHVTAKPNAGPDQTTCQYSTAAMGATGTGTWSALGTNPVTTTIVTPTSPTTEITGFTQPGTYGYVWTSNGCTDTAYVTVIAKPNAGPDQTICQYTTTDMNGTGSGVWTVDPNNPSVITFANDTSPTTLTSGYNVAGTDTLYWTHNGCSDTVLIHVTAKPNAGPDQTTCQYSTATMDATGTGTWSALSTNPVTTTIVTPTSPTTEITGFTQPGTYGYVWTSNGCTDTAYVTVIAKPNAGPDQTICQYTTTDMNGTGSGVWTVDPRNPSVITFANDTSPTTLTSGYNVAGTDTLYWTHNGCSDTVLIHVTAKPNAGPDQTICQYSTATMGATGTGTWSALSTNPVTTTIVTPTSPTTEITGFTQPGTYGYVWTSNGCTDTAYVTVTTKPNAGPDQTTCLFSTVNMQGTGTGIWSALGTNPAATTIVTPTSPTTEITGFTVAGTYSYIWTANGCTDTATVTVITKPNAGPDQTICQYSTATMAATGTGTWSALGTNPVTTTIDSLTSPTTEIIGFTTAGTYGYIWTSTGGCSDTTYVTVNPKPNAGPGMNFCLPGSPMLYATGGPGVWSALSTNPVTTVILSPNNDTTAITGITQEGYYSYIWTVNGCTDTVEIAAYATDPAGPDQTICQYNTVTTGSFGTGTWVPLSNNPTTTTIANVNGDTTTISGFSLPGVYGYIWSVGLQCSDTFFVTVTPKPNAGPDDTTCQYSTGSLSASGAGIWSALSTNPAVTVIVSPSSAGTAITGLILPGTYGYVWTVNGCTDTAYVVVTAKPNAGPDQTICEYSTTMMEGTGTGTWTAAAGNPSTVIFTNPNDSTTSVSGFTAPGTDTLYWSNNGCNDTVLINVTAKPNAGPDQTICEYSTTVMAATGSGTWTLAPGNPSVITFTNNTSPTTGVSGFTAPGTDTLYWSLNGCSDTVLINVTAKPDAGPDQTICQFSNTVMAATGSGTWTTDPNNPSVITFTNNTSPTTGVSGFTVPGTDTLYWSDNGCSDTVLINVIATPNAGTDQTICQYSTAIMNATGTGTWTASAGNPAAVTFANATDSITSVSGFTAPGTYILYWSLNGCSDSVLINVTAKPNAGTDQTICQYSTTAMNATGNGTWTLAAGNPSVITIANATLPTTGVSGFTVPGTDTLYWSDNGCSDTVLINVTAKPNAGPSQTICQNSTATTAATGSGTWTAAPGNPAVITFTNPNDSITTVTGFVDSGTYALYWSNNGCSDTTYVYVSETSTISVSQSSTGICPGQNDTITATVSVPGGSFLWAPGGATTQGIIVSTATTTTYTVTYTLAVCGTYTDSAIVTVYPPLTLTTQNDTICNGSTATLSTTPSTTGGTYLWSPGNFTTSSITVTPNTNTTYTVTYSLAGCPATSVSDTVDVTIRPTLTLNPATVCLGDSATLTAVPSQPGGTYTWSPGGATTQSITVAPGASESYTVSYAIPGSVCPPTTQTVMVTVTPQPTVSVNDVAICVGQSATLTATPSITGGTYVWAPGGATTASITETPATTSTYTVTYTIAGCGSATGSGTITVNPNPIVDSLIPQPITCYGYTNGTLTPVITPASGTYTYMWSNSETGAVDTGLAAGTYTLTITDQNGCTATDAVTGVIAAAPADGVAEVMPTDITVYQDSMIQLTTSLSNYTPLAYSWTPTGGLSCTNCPDPIVNTATATDTLLTYTVTISYSNGCTASATDSIHLLSGIAIPDAFTPNGDGKNDTFFIPAKGVNDFHMTIYNRWGELVFESYDPTNGWDGSYKGQPQPAGEYVFFVAITYYNGQSTARTGNITLLR